VHGDQPRPVGKKLEPKATFREVELIDSANALVNIPDPCDPMLGSDCNGNGVLDDCDIASGVSQDLSGDGIPDECQLTIHVPGDVLTIQDALDLLQGSLHKNPSQRGYHLTTKVDQKTVTKYVRQEWVPQVRAMTRNHLKVRKLLQRLSEANWRLLQLPPPD